MTSKYCMQIINPSIKLLQTEIHFELTYHSNGSDALFGNMLVQNYGYFLAYESEIDFMVLIIEGLLFRYGKHPVPPTTNQV